MPGEQYAFDFARSGRPHRDVHYFAVRPSRDAARAMVEAGKACRQRYGLTGRVYGMDRLHVSLVPVESWRGFRRGDVEAARSVAERIRAAPFAVALGRMCTFHGPGGYPVVLWDCDGAPALGALRRSLRGEMTRTGLWHGPARYEPHVTLLWDTKRVPDRRLDTPISWVVNEFVLVRSMVGRGRQIELGRWPLRA